MEIRVLVLGHKGMLGHMVLKYLRSKDISVETTDHRWPSEEFKNSITDFDGNFIINCIGAIHQKTNSFDVNWELPIFLDFYSKSKIIHPGTDCEMDNDPYGESKKIARDFIVNTSHRTKSLKTSIIGPEKNSNSSLMEWFLSNEDNSTVYGYTEFYWNGNTTLTWSEEAYKMIESWDSFEKETIISSECITKKEILDSINEVFNRNIDIQKKSDIRMNKCLNGSIRTPHIKVQLERLKEFYYDKD
jgi:dTDP-4-dehydrorhamnose reductase